MDLMILRYLGSCTVRPHRDATYLLELQLNLVSHLETSMHFIKRVRLVVHEKRVYIYFVFKKVSLPAMIHRWN